MRFHLRTLLILLAVGPPLLAWVWSIYPRQVVPPPVVYWSPAVIISRSMCDWNYEHPDLSGNGPLLMVPVESPPPPEESN
jgi:hypothetical protein